jgi:6-phosphofructokinase 1
MKADDVKGI